MVAAVVALPLVTTMGVPLAAVASGGLDSNTESTVTCTDDPVDTGTTVDSNGIETLDATQIGNAKIINSVGQQLSLPTRARIIAVATALQESSLRNLSYGDRDSLGLFQQRAAWGPASARTTPALAAEMFYTGGYGGQPGLIDIPDWETLSLTAAAQEVQRSAFPDAYAAREALATRLVATFGGSSQDCTDDSGITIPGDIAAELPDGFTLPQDTSATAAAAIAWALRQLGTSYHYGGDCTDAHSTDLARHCDCSSLVQQAYRAAGITLPRTTAEQINSGTPIYDTAELQAGDLLFLPGHVGIYLGSNLVLHAPKTGDVVKISLFQGYWVDNLTAMRRVSTDDS